LHGINERGGEKRVVLSLLLKVERREGGGKKEEGGGERENLNLSAHPPRKITTLANIFPEENEERGGDRIKKRKKKNSMDLLCGSEMGEGKTDTKKEGGKNEHRKGELKGKKKQQRLEAVILHANRTKRKGDSPSGRKKRAETTRNANWISLTKGEKQIESLWRKKGGGKRRAVKEKGRGPRPRRLFGCFT